MTGEFQDWRSDQDVSQFEYHFRFCPGVWPLGGLQLLHSPTPEVGSLQVLSVREVEEDVVGEKERVDLPDLRDPVLVDPSVGLQLQPEVPRGAVGQQALGVSEVNLDLSEQSTQLSPD